MRKLVFLLTMAVIAFSCKTDSGKGWVNLFNGKDLSGWHKVGGDASYAIEDGAIKGTTLMNTENTFLVSDQKYSDFILELELKVDNRLNSGIQIRSNSIPEYKNGRFHGYQVEIDPDTARKRFWSGGIYDEARRGWLFDLTDNEEGRNAFKFDDWNVYRIEAIGDTIKTWINGVAASHLVDGLTREGYIGLQVHSIGNDSSKKDIAVLWRNIKIVTDPQALKENSMKSTLQPKFYTDNTLSAEEKEQGWQLLFDGYSSNGWKGAYIDSFPAVGWRTGSGELVVVASDGAESQHGGDIVTLKQYKNFEFKIDFKLTQGANSGIKYYVPLDEQGNKGSAFGLEYQLLDDENHPDAKLGRDGNRKLGSLYDLMPAPADKPVKPVGEWNQAHIIANNNLIQYFLNGTKILEFTRGSEEFKKLVAQSKYADKKYNINGPFGEAQLGHILLQDHGDEVHFKNIKIKEL